MTTRNISPNRMFMAMAEAHTPLCQFNARRQDFAKWKEGTLPQVLHCLGDAPPTAAMEPELLAQWNEKGLLRQRWIINVQKYLSAVVLVNIPEGLDQTEQLPAILCCHGHGPFGKDAPMGNDSSPKRAADIEGCNYNYGEVMAQQGYVTYSLDWIGFGERSDSNKPNHSSLCTHGDWCNDLYLHATMFGMTSLSINIAHGKAATDFICSLPNVDSDKIGVMGLSGGGTMSLWMTLCDDRFKATEIICYSDLWAAFGIRDVNYCGMQVAPGLYKLVDVPDLQGLIAPRPLLIDIGARDDCFLVDTAMQCYQQLETIYTSADAADKLELDLHPGGHGWGANKSFVFFKKYLS